MTMKLTTNDKRKIYEQVMTAVTKQLDGVLNEGTWGPEPLQSDAALDKLDPIIKKNIDNFLAAIKKDCDDSADGIAWDAVGLCEFVMDMYIKMEKEFFLKDTPILDYYARAIKASYNEEWFKGWKDPEEIRSAVKAREKKLKEYTELINNWDKKKK